MSVSARRSTTLPSAKRSKVISVMVIVAAEMAALVKIEVYGFDPGEQTCNFVNGDVIDRHHPRKGAQLRAALFDPDRTTRAR